MPEDHLQIDIRQLRKDLAEAIRSALEGRSGIARMRTAADAERMETARLMAKADEMLAPR